MSARRPRSTTRPADAAPAVGDQRLLSVEGLDRLIQHLVGEGYTVVGPTIRQEAIVYDEIASAADLPVGWTDEQGPASYRLRRRDDQARFGYVVGPHSWKRFLFPPEATLLRSRQSEAGWQFETVDEPVPRYALLGVRACELAALAVQDRVFDQGDYRDPIYAARRAAALVIAVNCTQAAATCFCTSMRTGPRATAGFDLALTELDDGYLVEVGTPAGAAVLAAVPSREATPDAQQTAAAARQQAIDQIERTLDTTDIRDLLLSNLNHPRWDDVAQRCLSCTNCTMVCPTCFCSSVEEVSDLAGREVERRRHWDSCFNPDFSYMNGGVVRDSIRPRYRQWLTHKLASWYDQFGTSGCVGCGRCITWCPVGIDLTEEVAAIRGEAP